MSAEVWYLRLMKSQDQNTNEAVETENGAKRKNSRNLMILSASRRSSLYHFTRPSSPVSSPGASQVYNLPKNCSSWFQGQSAQLWRISGTQLAGGMIEKATEAEGGVAQ